MKTDSPKLLSPLKSIKQFCLACIGYSKKNRKECPDTDCELYNFRLGKNPNRRRITEKKICLGSESCNKG